MEESHVRQSRAQTVPRHMDGIVYQHRHRFESQVIGKRLIGVSVGSELSS